MATTNGTLATEQQQQQHLHHNSQQQQQQQQQPPQQHRLNGSTATMKPCLPSESSNGLKFKIKRTSTDDGRLSTSHIATQILPTGNGTYVDSTKTSAGKQQLGKGSKAPTSTASSGSLSSSSSGSSSPMSPAINASVNSPDSRPGKRTEPFSIRNSGMMQPSPCKKLKVSVEESESICLPRVSNGLEKDIGTMTEPESLGPCEPGTAVKLQGIVWQETDKGLLVLNVTWKGKTFMGTLLDCQRQAEAHKWGPPRDALSARGRTRRGGRNARSRTPPVKIPIKKGAGASGASGVNTNNKHGSGASGLFASTPVSPMTRGGHHGSHGRYREDDQDEDDEAPEDKCDALAIAAAASTALSPNSRLIECPKSDCSKKYRDLDALKYHLSFSHNDLKRQTPPPQSTSATTTTKADENGSKSKKAVTATNGVKAEVKAEVKTEIVEDKSIQKAMKQEIDAVKKEEAAIQNGHHSANNHPSNHNHGVMQMLGGKPSMPQGSTMNGLSTSATYINNIPTPPRSSAQLPQQQQQQQQQPRTISPAYSDISDEEPETTAPIGLTSKPIDPKQSLLTIRRESKTLPEPGRAPLDLTHPGSGFDPSSPFAGLRAPPMSAQFPGIPAHLLPGSVRFPPPPGLSTSTPSLNMLHSIMTSAKIQELQQAMAGVTSPLPAHRSPATSSSGSPNLPVSSPYSKLLPPPPPLRHEHTHTHLHLGPGFAPGLPSSAAATAASPMASKMAIAAAAAAAASEAAKRGLPPVSSGSLPMHLSPFSTGPFGLGPPRMASPYPPKP